MFFQISEKNNQSKESMSKLTTTINSRSKDKINSKTQPEKVGRMNYFTPKTYMKQTKLFSSKESKNEESLFTSSSDSNFLAKSTTGPKGKKKINLVEMLK